MEKPARDPRDEMPKPLLKSDVLHLEDLTVGIYLDVEILDRSLADYGVESGKSYKGSVTIGESNINFLEGENNVLTTSYSDVTILELSNGGNKESIGIENINIKYT